MHERDGREMSVEDALHYALIEARRLGSEGGQTSDR